MATDDNNDDDDDDDDDDKSGWVECFHCKKKWRYWTQRTLCELQHLLIDDDNELGFTDENKEHQRKTILRYIMRGARIPGDGRRRQQLQEDLAVMGASLVEHKKASSNVC